MGVLETRNKVCEGEVSERIKVEEVGCEYKSVEVWNGVL